MRVVVGISGASGVIYGIRALQCLRQMDGMETHLVLSDGARTNIAVETDCDARQVAKLADVVHRNDNLAASIASGSHPMDAMMVIPCSIKSLSGIANAYADNLLTRAADVMLKERRPLVLVVRETPLHRGHLELMMRAADSGASILPPVPAFYHKPKSIDDLVDHTVGKVFDLLGIAHSLYRRWGEPARVEHGSNRLE